jgi:hypothetical protein
MVEKAREAEEKRRNKNREERIPRKRKAENGTWR